MGWAFSWRPLGVIDSDVRKAIAASSDLVDVQRVVTAWDLCLAAPQNAKGDRFIHADLMPDNLLVRDGKLVTVIDFEGSCIGDPAVDPMHAWNLLPTGPRDTFRIVLGVDNAIWDRGCGWAISQAIEALPYYIDTNPTMAQTARNPLASILE